MSKRLEAFRGSRHLPASLHPAERSLIWVLGAQLCFLPWALGTMHAWSQGVSVALAAAAFGLAIGPRHYEAGRSRSTPAFRFVPWLKLRRFPIFWLGLLLFAYVALQALNPAWHYVQMGNTWWLAHEGDIAWLPAGIAAPFVRFNASRDLIVYASAWLTICAIWVGLTRRRSLRILLGVIVANGLALGLLLVAQHVGGEPQIPGPLTLEWPNLLTASFIYHNHAGAYFALVTFAAVALAMWYADEGARALRKSTPGLALGLAAACLGGAVFFTLSRGATLTLFLGLLVFALWFSFLVRRQPTRANPAVTKTLAAVLAVFALVAFRYLDLSSVYHRFDTMAAQGGGEEAVWTRVLIHRAARDMLRDYWLRGAGAGGFRYLSPEYVQHYPAIYQRGHLYWDHAHSDWLEIPIELGLTGDLLLLAGGAWTIGWFIRRKAIWHPLAIPLLLGCAQTLLHAAFDFPLQCPAILITWCALLAMAGRAVEMSGQPGRG